MKRLLPLMTLLLTTCLSAEASSVDEIISEITTEITQSEVAAKDVAAGDLVQGDEVRHIAPLNAPSSSEPAPAQSTADEQIIEQPHYVTKPSKEIGRRQRSRHVLDCVLAGIVTVGTVIAICLL